MEHILPIRKTALALFIGIYTGSVLAYTEVGQLGNTATWETQEYLKDWG